MSTATSTDTQSPELHTADTHDLIRVQGARENNLKDISIELPKRRLTVFTGVSGSGKSSLVFATIAAESQRMINETYSTFVQGFMPTSSVNRVVKVPSDAQPTAKQTSVTLRSPRRSSAIARSIRRVIR